MSKQRTPLEKLSIHVASPKEWKRIENAKPILSFTFQVKACREKGKRERTYYLLCNGALISLLMADSINSEDYFRHRADYIRTYLEWDLLLAAIGNFELALRAAAAKVDRNPKLHRELYRETNELIASSEIKRRNLRLRIKSGRPPGSKKIKAKYSKDKLYSEIKRHLRGYFKGEEDKPSQDTIAKLMGLGYAKSLSRELKMYREARSWKALVADLHEEYINNPN